MAEDQELKAEQHYFDLAWDAREETRRTLGGAHGAASGPRAAASMIRRGADKELEKLGGPNDPVAFARFDEEEGERLYLGKHAISDSSRDLLVINWQAPAAAPYFQASYDDPCGVIMRRKFTTERNRVLDFEEVVFAELARRVESMTESERTGIDDTVLRDLEQDRTGEMQDIVQTIHAAQYKLVRSPLEQLLVIQGGPGTGKTAVALHRVSWLLFNHRGSLGPDGVLVIGPNPTFTRYIRAVLPGLGDAEVQHRDLRSLGPQASTGREEEAGVARLKGNERMVGLLETALSQRVRFPAGVESIDVGPDSGAARFERAEIQVQLKRLVQSASNYATGRIGFRSWLGGDAAIRARGQVTPTQIDNATERVWPSLTPQAFLRDLFGSRERLVAAAGDEFTAGDIPRLLRPPAARLADEEWSDADISLLDEADSLINGSARKYAHIVIDEAQDLSQMQLRSLRRRSNSGSMTLVGDLAQSTGPWARDSWDDVIESLEQEHPALVEELTLGYRVPEQVFALAAQLLPEAAPNVSPPRVVRVGPADPSLQQVEEGARVDQVIAAARDFAGRGLFVGIVCPEVLRDALVEELQTAGVAWSDASKGNLSKSINVVRPEEAKGLEFDAVIVLEPEEIVAESERGLRLLYVALTRTTRYLSVVHSGRLLPLTTPADTLPDVRPPAMVESHAAPPPGVLEVPQLDVQDPDPAARSAEPAAQQSSRSSAGAVGSPLAAASKSADTHGMDIARVVTAAVAESLASNVRASVAEPLWPFVVDRLRRELDISDADLFELFD